MWRHASAGPTGTPGTRRSARTGTPVGAGSIQCRQAVREGNHVATPEQFIVVNTSEDWKALQYVREWCAISSAIDIATGHFEVGAFLALDGAWQKVDKIRLLIGGETSRTTAD